MNEVRWGILGTGNIAHLFASDFQYAKTGVLKAVASRNKKMADAFATEHDIELAMVDYYSLLNSQEVDVVYVATPHSTHYELTKAAILSGKSVLCEKPITLTEHQAKEIFELAEEHQVFVMEAMWSRFLPAVEQAIEWVEENEIGELAGIQASFNFKGPSDPEHRLLNLELGGGALMDVGIYPVFLAQLFLGKPDFIQNQVVIGDTDVDLFEQIMLGWENGQLASLESSILAPAPNRAVLSGTEGYIEFDPQWFETKAVRLIKADGSERAIEFEYDGRGYQFEIEEVNRCLIEGLLQSPNHSWQDSLNLLSTLDEIRQDMGVIYADDAHGIEADELEHHHHEHHHHKH